MDTSEGKLPHQERIQNIVTYTHVYSSTYTYNTFLIARNTCVQSISLILHTTGTCIVMRKVLRAHLSSSPFHFSNRFICKRGLFREIEREIDSHQFRPLYPTVGTTHLEKDPSLSCLWESDFSNISSSSPFFIMDLPNETDYVNYFLPFHIVQFDCSTDATDICFQLKKINREQNTYFALYKL